MAQNADKSKLMAQLKQKSKGSWARNRKTLEPKARGMGGFPPNLKNAVVKVTGYKFDKTEQKVDANGNSTGGDPYFSLSVVGVEPDEITNRRAAISWFLNESQYATYEENESALMNDLALLGKEPPDIGDVPAAMQELVDEGCHAVINTGNTRSNNRSPNLFIQGLADGYESNGRAPAAETSDSESAAEAAGESDVPEAADEGDAEHWVPDIGDQYAVSLGNSPTANCEVTSEPRDDGKVKVKMLDGSNEGKSYFIDPSTLESYIEEPEPEPEPAKPARKPAAKTTGKSKAKAGKKR